MNLRKSFFTLLIMAIGILVIAGCNSSKGGPKDLLDRYFSSAIRQDYAATYACYYAAYKNKINIEDYIRHRKEASVLQSYKILSLNDDGISAHAETQLTFGPSQKLNRKDPVSIVVKEEMIKEGGEWKIKVW